MVFSLNNGVGLVNFLGLIFLKLASIASRQIACAFLPDAKEAADVLSLLPTQTPTATFPGS
ncbi:MAG: hypothetical protein LRZ98_00480 [Candidatus Pacebacteria bacterium]|nr:hypothetical protein [Candidatus Paceibacterota bacterium]